MNQFELIARFNAWVNLRLYEVAAEVPDEAYRTDRGLFFGSIDRTLNHLLAVDRLWTGRIESVDRGVSGLDVVLYDDFGELARARIDEDARLVRLVTGMDEAALSGPVTYSRIIGTGAQVTRCDHILLTLFNHQTHHRGQVHAALTQEGRSVPPLDLIYFLEEAGLS